eukprot:gnl/TRDRNA2_/TRDRNA2_166157_c0_seq1.p1 gnl/TRDRNA2_/TRDRNA2_166157_c0~~gnl/TRDRNA2_/TRDRNA2_166157_c0_seq1.p1  ORF type:complete len:699 (-),score=98.80 gnl/TRDRNA2_/TRDRNA2_166157_c0_seq1:41-1903(-)
MTALAARCGGVVHVGAVPGPSEQPPPGVDPAWSKKAIIGLETIPGLELLRLNLMGTCGLFEALARERGVHGRRIVFSSSLFAMGWSHDPGALMPEYLPLDEAHPPLPVEHYGLSKALAESFAHMLTRADDGNGPSFVHLRFSNIIKEEKWGEFPLPAPASRVTPLMWAYCHEHDVLDAHIRALDLPREALSSSCESFLLVADDTRYDATTADLLAQHWGSGAGPPLRRPLPGYTSIVANEKIKQVLGLVPRSFRQPLPPEVSAERTWSTFKIPADFKMKGGGKLDGGYLAYKTYGVLNADASNAILHPTSFDAVHWELEFNVGPGRLLDTDKYFVVIINMLGNGVSTSPSTCSSQGSGPDFPVPGGPSLCDNVRLQALLLDSLGISILALIYGYSMGAMQALQWGVLFPDRVRRIAAVCGSARCSDYNVVFLDSLEAALRADPDCSEVNGRLVLTGSCMLGLRAFARIYSGWGVPMEFYQQELWRQSSRDGKPFTSREDFVARSYDAGFAGSHPLNLLAQVHTWRTADVSKASGLSSGITFADALARVKARVYLMPCTTDRYFTVPEISEEAKLLPNCRLLPIQSAWGHRAGDPHRPGQQEDARFLKDSVGELLSEQVKP